MGFNTVVLLYNDEFHNIKKDEKFGERLVQAALEADRYENVHGKGNVKYATSVGFNYGMVYPSFHASGTQVFAGGGNSLVSLGLTFGNYPLDDESAVETLKSLANQYGYALRKKPKK